MNAHTFWYFFSFIPSPKVLSNLISWAIMLNGKGLLAQTLHSWCAPPTRKEPAPLFIYKAAQPRTLSVSALFGKERRVFVFLFATDFHREDSHCQKRNTKRSKLSSICRGKQRLTPEHRASITLRANMISSLPTKVTFWLTMSHMGKQEAIESLP